MLKRARAVVLGTVECSCAAENTSTPPGGDTTRTSGSSSSDSVALGCSRVSFVTCFEACFRPVRFHSS